MFAVQLSCQYNCSKAPNVTVVNGRMYVTATEENEDCDPMIEMYNPIEDQWLSYASSIGWRPANSSISCVHAGRGSFRNIDYTFRSKTRSHDIVQLLDTIE